MGIDGFGLVRETSVIFRDPIFGPKKFSKHTDTGAHTHTHIHAPMFAFHFYFTAEAFASDEGRATLHVHAVYTFIRFHSFSISLKSLVNLNDLFSYEITYVETKITK